MILKPGVYDELITRTLRQAIADLPNHFSADIEALEPGDAVDYLAREVAGRVRALLHSSVENADNIGSSDASIATANNILDLISAGNPAELNILTRIRPAKSNVSNSPVLPLSLSALITNDQDINYHKALRDELSSADRVDFICPFIGNQGLNLIFDLLQMLGKRLRVITTTYLGGTNVHALERLARVGAQVKIVYEGQDQKTGLHAKAWIFHRDSGFTTATIGSSNLSPRALADGLEWNVRLGARDAPQVIKGLTDTFSRLWANPVYEPFDPDRDLVKAKKAIDAQSGKFDAGDQFYTHVSPYPHQVEGLDQLQLDRLDGRHRNLIVAATGTGKTLMAAFDYDRLARAWTGLPSLLYVAHRGDILKQSLGAFRAVIRGVDFGALNVGQDKAVEWKHVFASVQSLAAMDLSKIDPAQFDIVIIDEFHHAEAPTYARLLTHFQPRELLALTATPERTDGQRTEIGKLWPPSFELRLWHALERQLLCPFHYFGINDETNLSEFAWTHGRYSDSELDREYIDHGKPRADLIIRELREKCDLSNMRAVAFCATVNHAKYMARAFKEAAIDARALHSQLPEQERGNLVRSFRRGEIPLLCTVDLFNEGVDIPEINTVLFLRPTESATIFIQQLGRGLRNNRDKGALTVLDFVGQQNRKFRMDLRFAALTGYGRSDLERAIRKEFPRLPPGCDIRLDKVTQDHVLSNLRQAIPTGDQSLRDELRRIVAISGIPTLQEFLTETGLEPQDLYRHNRSFMSVKHAAGVMEGELPASHRKIQSVVHADDRIRLNAYKQLAEEGGEGTHFSRMLGWCIGGGLTAVGLNPEVRKEMVELFDILLERSQPHNVAAEDLPFSIHARYNRDEIAVPFIDNPGTMRQGTFYARSHRLDVHLITLRKSERDFSPSTRYQDWFESPNVLHWESQSTTTAASATGRRLIEGEGRHLCFVRERKDEPYSCLGFVRPIASESEKPIKLTWALEHSVPDHTYVRFRAAAG